MAQQEVNYNRAPLFLSDVKSLSAPVLNPEVTEQTLVRGTILGRIAAGDYQPLKSGASDSSQYPKAILMSDITLAPGAKEVTAICVRADVNADGIVFDGTDTLSTVIEGERLFDHMVRYGLYPEQVQEFTEYDN